MAAVLLKTIASVKAPIIHHHDAVRSISSL